MNLPNKLTVVRMVLVPFFVASLLLSGSNETLKWVALVLFVVASLTDFLDGYIARKYNLITNFGKFMDPLADKILTISGMICLIELGRIPSWIVVIIVAREFIISGFRLIAAENGVVIAANQYPAASDPHESYDVDRARTDDHFPCHLYQRKQAGPRGRQVIYTECKKNCPAGTRNVFPAGQLLYLIAFWQDGRGGP